MCKQRMKCYFKRILSELLLNLKNLISSFILKFVKNPYSENTALFWLKPAKVFFVAANWTDSLHSLSINWCRWTNNCFHCFLSLSLIRIKLWPCVTIICKDKKWWRLNYVVAHVHAYFARYDSFMKMELVLICLLQMLLTEIQPGP